MQERNLKVIEGLLFVLFILLWGLFLSGGSGKVKRRTLSLWQYIPVHTEVFHDFFENSIRKGQYELTPILGYDTYEGNAPSFFSKWNAGGAFPNSKICA